MAGEVAAKTAAAAHPLAAALDFWHRFLSEMHAPDWIQAGLLLIAIGALIYTARTLRESARGRDVENHLTFMEKLNSAWKAFGTATNDDDRYVEFTNLVNLFEASCHLFNKKVIIGTTREMIRDYLKDMLPVVFADEMSRAMIVRARTHADTYGNIRIFAKKNKLQSVLDSWDAKAAIRNPVSIGVAVVSDVGVDDLDKQGLGPDASQL